MNMEENIELEELRNKYPEVIIPDNIKDFIENRKKIVTELVEKNIENKNQVNDIVELCMTNYIDGLFMGLKLSGK